MLSDSPSAGLGVPPLAESRERRSSLEPPAAKLTWAQKFQSIRSKFGATVAMVKPVPVGPCPVERADHPFEISSASYS